MPWWVAAGAGVGSIATGAGIAAALRFLVPYWAARSVARRWPQILEEERRRAGL